jgi:hypothetical protein
MQKYIAKQLGDPSYILENWQQNEGIAVKWNYDDRKAVRLAWIDWMLEEL